MTNPTPSNRYTRFYDQVLGEIERGRVDQGLGLLVGMLDAVHMQGGGMAPARSVLTGHMLQQLLVEAPLYRRAGCDPTEQPQSDMPVLSPTGSTLMKASAALTIMRALGDRQHLADQRLARTWRDGGKICLVGGNAMTPGHVLHGRDLSNVTIAPATPAAVGGLATGAFDLICAPNLADTVKTSALPSLLAGLHRAMAPEGTLILSALLPDHVGAGWVRGCLDWHPQAHAEAALRGLAGAAGFKAQFCNDESNCLVWGVLRSDPANNKKGPQHAGH
jgi:hypothetical protein